MIHVRLLLFALALCCAATAAHADIVVRASSPGAALAASGACFAAIGARPESADYGTLVRAGWEVEYEYDYDRTTYSSATGSLTVPVRSRGTGIYTVELAIDAFRNGEVKLKTTLIRPRIEQRGATWGKILKGGPPKDWEKICKAAMENYIATHAAAPAPVPAAPAPTPAPAPPTPATPAAPSTTGRELSPPLALRTPGAPDTMPRRYFIMSLGYWVLARDNGRVYIAELGPKGGADAAGLQKGDELLEIAGEKPGADMDAIGEQMMRAIRSSRDRAIEVEVRTTNNRKRTVTIEPRDPKTGQKLFGR